MDQIESGELKTLVHSSKFYTDFCNAVRRALLTGTWPLLEQVLSNLIAVCTNRGQSFSELGNLAKNYFAQVKQQKFFELIESGSIVKAEEELQSIQPYLDHSTFGHLQNIITEPTFFLKYKTSILQQSVQQKVAVRRKKLEKELILILENMRPIYFEVVTADTIILLTTIPQVILSSEILHFVNRVNEEVSIVEETHSSNPAEPEKIQPEQPSTKADQEEYKEAADLLLLLKASTIPADDSDSSDIIEVESEDTAQPKTFKKQTKQPKQRASNNEVPQTTEEIHLSKEDVDYGNIDYGTTSSTEIRSKMIEAFYLQKKEPVTWDKILHKVQSNRARTALTLDYLLKDNIVTQTGKGLKGFPFKYALNLDYTSLEDLKKKFEPYEKKYAVIDRERKRLFEQSHSKKKAGISSASSKHTSPKLAPEKPKARVRSRIKEEVEEEEETEESEDSTEEVSPVQLKKQKVETKSEVVIPPKTSPATSDAKTEDLSNPIVLERKVSPKLQPEANNGEESPQMIKSATPIVQAPSQNEEFPKAQQIFPKNAAFLQQRPLQSVSGYPQQFQHSAPAYGNAPAPYQNYYAGDHMYYNQPTPPTHGYSPYNPSYGYNPQQQQRYAMPPQHQYSHMQTQYLPPSNTYTSFPFRHFPYGYY